MINFKDAQLLSYSQESRFLGDASFRFGVKRAISLRGNIDNYSNTDGVSGIWSGRNAIVEGAIDWDDIVVNNINLGLGRVVSIEFEEGDNVRNLPYIVNLEVFDTGSLYNMTGEMFEDLSDVFTTPSLATELLDSISETFDFSISRDGEYSYTQNLNIKYLSGDATNPLTRTKLLASGIMGATAPFGFINAAHSGFYNQQGRKLYRETYNEITYECSFQKSFSVIHIKSGYGASITQSINTNADGITSVTEQGDIEGIFENIYDSMVSGLLFEIESSYARCSGVYDFYQAGNQYPLNNIPIELGRTLNKFEGLGSYSVVYSNDPKNSSGYSWEYTLSYDRDSNDIYTVSEAGTLIGLKSSIGSPEKFAKALSGYNAINPGIPSRVQGLYNDVTNLGNTLHLISKGISTSRYQGKIDYNWSYSDDTAIIDSGTIFKSTVATTNNPPTHLFGLFEVPNVAIIAQDGRQTNFGTFTVDINFDLKRNNDSEYDVDSLVGTARSIANSRMASVDGDDVHVEDCTYSIDDIERVFTFSATWNYIKETSTTIVPNI